MALHWLPVKYLKEFKVATLVYKALKYQAPEYIMNLFKFKNSERTWRSNSNYKVLHVLHVRKAIYAMRSLSVKGPQIWNELENEVKKKTTIISFKAKRKWFMFKKAYKC